MEQDAALGPYALRIAALTCVKSVLSFSRAEEEFVNEAARWSSIEARTC